MSPSRWIFIMGLSGGQRHWAMLPAVVKSAFPQSEVLTIDHAGFGTERHRSSALTIKQMTADIRTRLPQLKAGETQGLIGISMGGMIGLSWADMYPEEINRLVVINSSAADVSPPHRRFKPSALPHFVKIGRVKTAEERVRLVMELTTNNIEARKLLFEERVALTREHQPRGQKNFLLQLQAAATFRSPKNLKVPTLFLGGAKDRFVDSSCTERLARKYKAPVFLHPDAGHELHADAPEWIIDRMKEWLKNPASSEIVSRT